MPDDAARFDRLEAQIAALTDYLDQRFAQVKGELTVTRADLNALTAYLDQRFAALEQRMDTLQDRFERSETTMLTAFHQHLGRHNAQWTAVRILATQALDAIEELRARVDKLEGKASQ